MAVSKTKFYKKSRRVLFQNNAAGAADGIYVISDGSEKFEPVYPGELSAENIGMSADAANNLSVLQAALNRLDVNVIAFNNPKGASYTVTGTLTIPAGKVLHFSKGNKITGNAVINGGIINAPMDAHIFDTSVIVNPENVAHSFFSAKWYGAKGANTSDDDSIPLQKSIDVCVRAANFNSLLIPAGVYTITKGLLVLADNNADGIPEFTRIRIMGSSSSYFGLQRETTIKCTHGNNFALAMQWAKACEIKNINFVGPNQLNYIFGDITLGWNESNPYNIGGLRENKFSPFSAIVLDPFGNSVTGSDRYPGFESYYTAAVAGTTGSTDCRFENITIDGFIVGVMHTPNGNTQNNECHTYDNVWIQNCKDGFVTTNSQERTVYCRNFKFWNSVKTCFRSYGYGLDKGEPPIIDGCNVAGGVFEIFHLQGTGGYFPSISIKNLFAELFYRIGTIIGFNAAITHSNLNIGNMPAYGKKAQDWILDFSASNGIRFSDTILINHNNGIAYPINFKTNGPVKFTNCLLSQQVGVPFNQQTDEPNEIEYEDCRFTSLPGAVRDGAIFSGLSNYWGLPRQYVRAGKVNTTYSYSQRYGGKAPYAVQYRKAISPFHKFLRFPGVAVTVTGNTATATIPQLGGAPQFVNRLVYDLSTTNGMQLMRIHSIDGAGNIVFNHICERVVTGVYELFIVELQYLEAPVLFDYNGSAYSNVFIEGSTAPHTLLSNYTYYHEQYPVTVFGPTAGAAGANQFGPGQVNVLRGVLCNYSYEEGGSTYGNPLTNPYFIDGVFFTRGAFYKNIDESSRNILGWLCVQSGIKGSSALPVFIPKYVNEVPQLNDYFSIAADGSRAMEAGSRVTLLMVKPSVLLPAFKIGTSNGGEEIIGSMELAANVWSEFIIPPSAFFEVAGNIYFGGISATTQIKIIKTML